MVGYIWAFMAGGVVQGFVTLVFSKWLRNHPQYWPRTWRKP